jgi:hypothetical protein
VDVSAFYGVLIVVTQAITVIVYEIEAGKSDKKKPPGERALTLASGLQECSLS